MCVRVPICGVGNKCLNVQNAVILFVVCSCSLLALEIASPLMRSGSGRREGGIWSPSCLRASLPLRPSLPSWHQLGVSRSLVGFWCRAERLQSASCCPLFSLLQMFSWAPRSSHPALDTTGLPCLWSVLLAFMAPADYLGLGLYCWPLALHSPCLSCLCCSFLSGRHSLRLPYSN